MNFLKWTHILTGSIVNEQPNKDMREAFYEIAQIITLIKYSITHKLEDVEILCLVSF